MVVRELHLALAEQNTPNRKSDAHKTKSITKQKELEKNMSKKSYWLCHMTGVCSENIFNTTWRVTDLVSHRSVRHKVMALQQDPLQEPSLTRAWTQMDSITSGTDHRILALGREAWDRGKTESCQMQLFWEPLSNEDKHKFSKQEVLGVMRCCQLQPFC